jgi:hypothetical protein
MPGHLKKLFQSGMVIIFAFLFVLLISMVYPINNSFAATPAINTHEAPQLLTTDNFTFLPLVLNGHNAQLSEYVLLGWNDLGMHCYNRDFQDLAVLPPYNNLWAQVIKRGDPPQIVTDQIKVEYSFPDNTYSVGKSNFWTYAQSLFNLAAPLPDNVGLTGRGLAGEMDAVVNDHFVADGIPLTEFSDSAPATAAPYQLAEIVASDAISGEKLAELTVVAPVSTEMHCDYCHFNGGVEGISTGKVETNILTLHDRENANEYPSGTGLLMNNRPVLCAGCHASNALGAPGVNGIPNFSNAMHNKHKEIVPDTLQGCYSCHPGPTTECLRDVMSTEHNMDCVDCHGGMDKVSQNTNPWLKEPTCSQSGCHTNITQNQPLYRNSTAHGGIYCAACHDSPHAIAPSREANDSIKFFQLQNQAGPLNQCLVCHITQPEMVDPHSF